MISAFAITMSSTDSVYPGKLIREPFGLFYLDDNLQKQKIELKDPKEALYRLKDPVTITIDKVPFMKSPLGGTDKPIKTTIGSLMCNLISVFEPFKGKLHFIEGKFTPSTVEGLIAPVLESNPETGEPSSDVIYVQEYEDFYKAVTYLETLSSLFVHSVTEVGLLPPPGRKEFKKKLLERYKGKLNDPIESSKFDAELKAFDQEYLKQDPSYGKFMSSKVVDARVEMYMTQGGQIDDFGGTNKVTTVVNSLEDGVPLKADEFVALVNSSRYGSYSRGAETVNGGVVAKALMRAADNWRITEGDCGSKLGVTKVYGEKDVSKLVGRYLLQANKVTLVETIEQAKDYINRKVTIRSPQYCTRPGNQTCACCAGVALTKYPKGISIPLMEVSGGILTDSLKKMHANKVETVTLDLQSIVT